MQTFDNLTLQRSAHKNIMCVNSAISGYCMHSDGTKINSIVAINVTP